MRVRLLLLTIVFVIRALTCADNLFGQHAEGVDAHRLALPDKNWSLDISIPHLPVKEQLENGGREYSLKAIGIRDRNPVVFTDWTIKMVPEQAGGDEASLRDFTISTFVKKGLVDKHGVKTSDYNHLSMATYIIFTGSPNEPAPSQFAPFPSRFKVLEAYLVRENVWITITLKSSGLGKSDERAFCAALDSIKVSDISAPSTSFDYYEKGHALILQKEYQRAVEPLSAAFALEQTKRQLNQVQWRGLIEHLAIAYGDSANTARAKEILDYGVRNDPTCPIFHWFLARYYASVGDLDNTIASLEKAFLDRKSFDRMKFRNPMYDPTFKLFWNVDKFRKAVKAMNIGLLL